jgi:N6-L-threonylcarbamoyladenine synthase
MKVLAIESSCDDTSVAVVEDGHRIHSNLISSQLKIHQPHGGVVPELASRRHAEVIHTLITKSLQEAECTFDDIDAIAVTYGPGLEGALLVGITAAKALSKTLNKPLIGVNHLHGHIYAHYLTETPPAFPYIALIASGGHTQLVLVESHASLKLLGQTRDDAAGEAFDKVARVLGLPYPGGPHVEKEAQDGDKKAFKFPIGMKHDGLEFSFSGLKTAVIQTVNKLDQDTLPIADLCASFQDTVIRTLWLKTKLACETHGVERVALCGGVMANQTLQTVFQEEASQAGITIHNVPKVLCTDNAAMIGAAACLSELTIKDQTFYTTPQLKL